MPESRNGGLLAVSLFSGAGGMDYGFSQAGFRVRVALDNQESMCWTHRRNFPETVAVGPPDHSGDIRGVDGEYLLDVAGLKRGSVALVVGGPPCQPFSIAANQRFMKGDEKFKRKGFADRKRGNLVDEFARVVLEIKPHAFCLENVPGLADIDSGRKLRKLVQDLRKAGYYVDDPIIVDAADYGVPQFRRRLFLLGARGRNKPIGFPLIQYGEGLFSEHPYRTVAHALVGLDPNMPNHVTREHNPSSIARYRKLSVGEREHLGRVDRLDPRRPSKTVIAGGTNGGGRSHLHPFLARTLTVRECARLQTFDDSFIFEGKVARQFTQVGNAVPPLLAERIGRHMLRAVFGISTEPGSTTARYLEKGETLEELCDLLSRQAIEERAEWLYEDVAWSAKQGNPRTTDRRELALSLSRNAI